MPFVFVLRKSFSVKKDGIHAIGYRYTHINLKAPRFFNLIFW